MCVCRVGSGTAYKVFFLHRSGCAPSKGCQKMRWKWAYEFFRVFATLTPTHTRTQRDTYAKWPFVFLLVKGEGEEVVIVLAKLRLITLSINGATYTEWSFMLVMATSHLNVFIYIINLNILLEMLSLVEFSKKICFCFVGIFPVPLLPIGT